MKLTVDTKFSIGDVVYVVDHYYDYYASHRPYVVTDIIINIDNRNTRVTYCVECGEHIDRFPEEWLFTTYEECARWCDEHN